MVAFDAESSQEGEHKTLKEMVLIKDGKVRLLIGKKEYVLSLDKLSEADQKFVNDLEAKRKTVTGQAAAAAAKPHEE